MAPALALHPGDRVQLPGGVRSVFDVTRTGPGTWRIEWRDGGSADAGLGDLFAVVIGNTLGPE